MESLRYPALVYKAPGEESWTILFPDFPEIASAADPHQDPDQQASDALATVLDFYAEAGKPLPHPSRSVDIMDQIPAGATGAIVFYPAEGPELVA